MNERQLLNAAHSFSNRISVNIHRDFFFFIKEVGHFTVQDLAGGAGVKIPQGFDSPLTC